MRKFVIFGYAYVLFAGAANAATIQFQCKVKEKVGALEAGESFTLKITDQKVSVTSEYLNLCTGAVKILKNKIIGKASIGGSRCAADGFNLLIERSMLEDAATGYASVPTNDPSDLYYCVQD